MQLTLYRLQKLLMAHMHKTIAATAFTNFDQVLLEQPGAAVWKSGISRSSCTSLACSHMLNVPHPGGNRAEKANSWDVSDAFDTIWSPWGARADD